MERDNSKKDYCGYLTEKLDKGLPNIVVDTVLGLIKQNFLDSKDLKIADLGCYTGSIINRIYLSLSPEAKKNTILVGFDIDSEIIKEASVVRPHILFVNQDLSSDIKTDDTFDIVILSNLLHEIYSSSLPDTNKAKKQISNSLENVKNLTKIGGFMVLLDGILLNNPMRKIDIKFKDVLDCDKFIKFSNSGYVLDVPCEVKGNSILTTTVQGFASYLSKSRYLDTSFWDQEAQQIYHYFTKQEFNKNLLEHGFKIVDQKFQQVEDVESKIEILGGTTKFPHKNTLIISRRIS